MKKVSFNIMSMLLAFVVLISTTSVTFNMHYCGGTLVETALFQKAKGCGMDMQKPVSKTCSVTKKNCCDDKQLVIDGQDELQLQAYSISFEQQVFIVAFIHTYSNLFDISEYREALFSEYPPPLIVRQLYKLDESYLI